MATHQSYLNFLFTDDLYIVNESVSAKINSQADRTPTEVSGTCVVLENLSDQTNGMLLKLLNAIREPTPEFVTELDRSSGHAVYLVFNNQSGEEKYAVHRDGDQIVIYSDGLAMLNEDEQLKRKLWEQLKAVFLS